MSDEPTQLIIGDAAVDATTEGRRGSLRRRRKGRKDERVLTHCENCGAQLTGAFCAQCGQHAIDYRRSMWRVLIDAADSFFNWDTKFLSTVGILLARPWKLTADFNAGRRARYVHPLRLYLLASIAFFLMFKFIDLNSARVELGPQDRTEIATALARLTDSDSPLTPEQRAKVEAVRQRLLQGSGPLTEQEGDEMQEAFKSALAAGLKDRLARTERARLKAALHKMRQSEVPGSRSPTPAPSSQPTPESSVAPAVPTPSSRPQIQLGTEPGKHKSQMAIWFENRIKQKVGSDGSKSKLFVQTLFNNMPTMMLCCVPLFALLLKVLYIRKRRYYIEHLVYALHIHTFAYLAIVVITLLGLGLGRISDVARGIVTALLCLLLVVQVFLSIRRVYAQGWIATTIKFVVGGIAYFVILVCAVGTTAFITLLLPD